LVIPVIVNFSGVPAGIVVALVKVPVTIAGLVRLEIANFQLPSSAGVLDEAEILLRPFWR
jgi:hypothetical protein